MSEGSAPSTNRQIQFEVITFDQSRANVVLTDPMLVTLTMVSRSGLNGPALFTKLSFNSNLGDQLLICQAAGGSKAPAFGRAVWGI